MIETTPISRVNSKTGEVIEMLNVVVPVGTQIRTPKQQEATRKWLNARKTKTAESFYFIQTDCNPFEGLSPQSIAKLVMLCTYINYDSKLVKSPKEPITKANLKDVLGISKAAAYAFIKDVKNYLIEKPDGLYISEQVNIFRHSLHKDEKHLYYQKMYIKAIRKLYSNTEVRKHTQLGYVFMLLPYINREYNIFCQNPFEDDINVIEPLTIKDFCNLVGYDSTKAKRLIEDLQSLTFNYKGQSERLISYSDNGNSQSGQKMLFVNPHIVYVGTKYSKTEILTTFCKIKTGH